MLYAVSGRYSSRKNGHAECTVVKPRSLSGIISFRNISQYEHVFGSHKATEVRAKVWEYTPNSDITVWEPV